MEIQDYSASDQEQVANKLKEQEGTGREVGQEVYCW